jgi:hypothetical protein
MYKSLKFYIVSVNFDGRKEKQKKKKKVSFTTNCTTTDNMHCRTSKNMIKQGF